MTVMNELLPRMANSSNANVREVGTALRAFWDHDMERTNIWTPGWVYDESE